MMHASMRRLYLYTAIGIAAVTCCCSAYLFAHDSGFGESFFRLYSIVMMILIVVWLASDPSLPAAERPSFDHGLLLWALFPLLAIYQQFIVRRWRGVVVVLGLLVLLAAPALTYAVLLTFGE